MWETVSKDATDKGLISKIYKQHKQLNSKKKKKTVEIWAKDISTKKIYRWSTSTLKNAQHHYLLENWKSKLLWVTNSHQSELPLLTCQQITNAGEGVEKLNIELAHDPALPLLGIYPDKTFLERDTCTCMFTASLFTVAKTWKQPKCPTDKWIKEEVL